MGSRKKKKKRKQKQRGRPLRRPVPLGLPPGPTLLVEPPGAKKMSEVLLEFLEPYTEQWRTEEDLRRLLPVAIIVWNAALVSGREREELLQGALDALPPGARQDGRTLLEELIRRKEAHFADNHRLVLDYQLTMRPAGPHLSVISTFEPM